MDFVANIVSNVLSISQATSIDNPHRSGGQCVRVSPKRWIDRTIAAIRLSVIGVRRAVSPYRLALAISRIGVICFLRTARRGRILIGLPYVPISETERTGSRESAASAPRPCIAAARFGTGAMRFDPSSAYDPRATWGSASTGAVPPASRSAPASGARGIAMARSRRRANTSSRSCHDGRRFALFWRRRLLAATRRAIRSPRFPSRFAQAANHPKETSP